MMVTCLSFCDRLHGFRRRDIVLFTLATEILVMKSRFLNVDDTVKISVTAFGR